MYNICHKKAVKYVCSPEPFTFKNIKSIKSAKNWHKTIFFSNIKFVCDIYYRWNVCVYGFDRDVQNEFDCNLALNA